MAGTDEPTQSEKYLHNSIIAYAWEQKKNGRTDSTVKTIVAITRLSKLCNIDDPEQAKVTLANQKWNNNSKRHMTMLLTGYYRYIGKTWERPKYTISQALPYIPTEEEIDLLIVSASRKTATLLQLLKETGMRIGEVERLKWLHIDQQRKLIYIIAEKGSNSRLLPISEKLIGMLNQLPKKTDDVFTTTKHGLRNTFTEIRNRTAKKLNNPRLKQIHFHTFRHWKATMEQHKYKDPWRVKEVLGHKTIKSTELYIHIESQLYLNQTDEFTCKTTKTPDDASKLIESGFTYVQTIDGLHLYRKRK
jgi:integrase